MRKMRVEDAVGETLCHDMTAILEDGSKGVRFKRGYVITDEDIPALLDIGKSHVFVWEPEAEEVHEDDAAIAVTKAICGDNLTYSGPSEGRMELQSTVDGLFVLNSAALKKINCVEDYTVVCRSNFTPVKKDEKVCGARIIPLVTKKANVDMAVAIANDNYPVLTVLPYKPLKCGVIITGSEVYYGRIKDRFQPIMEAKLNSYGAQILGIEKCPDDTEMIMAAIEKFVSAGAELVLLTGGMSVDPDDLTPGAIKNSGAEIIARGVPMQPGNMLTLAYLGNTMLMGVPGASMRLPTTSLEHFLPRIFAGLRITKEEIADLGEGGLCMFCKVCTWPICGFGRK